MTPALIAVFVVVEIVVTAIVLNRVLQKRGGLAAVLTRLRGFASAAGDIERETREYLRANWSGDACSLPAAVEPLLVKLQADLASRGLKVERSQLLPLVQQVILREKLGDLREVREALKRVA